NLAQAASEDLSLQLAAHGQVGRLVEEIVREIDSAFLARHIGQIHGRYFEELAGAFAITGRDNRSMDIEEALFLEKIVNRLADLIANAGNSAKGVGPRPQVRDGAQELERVALLLERVFLRIGPAVNGDAF